ncbi:MAG: ribonuclease Z [Thermoleophilia bacterium]
MDLRLVFLGTAGAVPTIDRGPSGIMVIRGGERFLIDCGEGTQRQLMRSVGLGRLDRVFLTHMHGDHYLGLPGLLKTLSLMGREDPLQIFGPPGTIELFQVSQRIFGRFSFSLETVEVVPGDEYRRDGYVMRAFQTRHGLPSVGWALEEPPRPGRFHPERAMELGVTPGPDFGLLQSGRDVVVSGGRIVRPEDVMDEPRPGRKVVVTGDTRPTKTVIEVAREAQVLVHDSTFTQDEMERARETRHSTAREAAEVAKEAKAGLLVLTHVSSRHSRGSLLGEARAVFPRAVLPDDLDHVVVPYPDKDRPRLVPGREALTPQSASAILCSHTPE